MIKNYYTLVKPGIVRGNLIVAVAAYLFASNGVGDYEVLVSLIVGTVGVIGSAGVLNNIYDRDIDAQMERTKDRALVLGHVSIARARMYAALLGSVGFATLFFGTTATAAYTALFGFFAYTILYTVFTKRTTVHATLVGTLSGATPPVIGYSAVTGSLDATALVLFLILVFWQMAHFLAIALFRKEEYAAASIPVMTRFYTASRMRVHIQTYIVLFASAVIALSFTYPVASWYAWVSGAIATMWLLVSIHRPQNEPTETWARRVFKCSLIVLLMFSLCLCIEGSMR